ncbi:MAG: MobC family plasmid mobilization relaxosome protein [Oscillospiraceae bacterium]|nr:MobC family plasmid mobilization relaxosome protein [Oscillospiraceae bacterium]
MRKYKQVHRKEVTYDLSEWKQIEKRAASVMLKTGTFIKRMSLEGKIIYFDMREVSEVMKALRIIGANINQITRKANDINNIYADDIEALRKEVEEIGHTLTVFLSNLPKLMSAT